MPIRSLLEVINQNLHRVAFVLDDDEKLCGAVSDGDVRRGLIAGYGLDDDVSSVMNREFVSFDSGTPNEVVALSLNEKSDVIPLTDADGRIVDLVMTGISRKFPIMAPDLSGNEMLYVLECLESSWVSSKGRFVNKFEELVSGYLDGLDAISTSSGTTALELGLRTLDIGPGDEVLVPDLTFAAPASVVLHTGATPILVDVRPDTWNIDHHALEQAVTDRTKAIIAVHLYGQPADMTPISEFAKKHDIYVIEDAAEGLGSQYMGKPLGTLSDVSIFSFFANKIITTGEGGVVAFRDHHHSAKARMLRDHGMSPLKRYWHEYAGFNFRMTNLQAALGVAQWERLDEFIQAKIRIGDRYRMNFEGLPHIQLPSVIENTLNINWLFTVLIDVPHVENGRDKIAQMLSNIGIETRNIFYPLHEMPPFQKFSNGDYPNATKISYSGLSLPSSATLEDADVDYVCEQLIGFVNKISLST